MTYRIRPFEVGDAEALATLTLDAIQSIGTQAYSSEQVRAWSSGHIKAERFLARAEAGHHIYVTVNKSDNCAAYALLEGDGHLDMLYCSPAHAGRGLAGRLLAHAEEQARQMKISRLYTEASELARSAFERAGYTMKHRRDFEISGVAIHNYAMEKAVL